MRDGNSGCKPQRRLREQPRLDGRPGQETMASFIFKRRNLLGRGACSYCLLLLALASIALFYVLEEYTSHRQSRLVPGFKLLHSDTDLHVHEHPMMQDYGGRNVLLLSGDVANVKNNTSGRHANKPASRFILGLNYWEQLTMATMNLFQLICLADLWNSSVVQPFTLDSRLYGLKNFKAGKLLIINLPKVGCYKI